MNSLTDKSKIKILKQVNRKLVHTLQDIKGIATNHEEYCRKNGYKLSKSIEKIGEIVDNSLTYLDCRKADLEELNSEVPRNQMQLGDGQLRSDER